MDTLGLVWGLAVPAAAIGRRELTEALLASNFLGVIGWRNPVPDRVAALGYFVLHGKLVDEQLDPVTAVRDVRRWMSDPARKRPPYLPAELEALADSAEPADRTCWGALIHHGV